MVTKAPTSVGLRDALVAAVGAAAVLDGDADRLLASHDVYASGGEPLAVVRPKDIPALQDAVRACAQAGIAMVPRGGGASYTDGYIVGDGGHVLFDCSGLDFIEVDAANATVRVGSGTTWAALKAALDPLGLRTPFWGPFSGIAATVGGSVSQNTISHGSGRHGISAGSVIDIEVILADGTLMHSAPSRATRNYGPDMTGLFTGDCGALGLKAALTLPLLTAQPAFEALSFAFETLADYHRMVSTASLEQLDDEHFGVDLVLSQGQIGKQQGIGAKVGIARDIMRSAPSLIAGVRQLARMALAGEGALRAANYMAHFLVEGVDAQEVEAKARRLRAIAQPIGMEIANTVPAFVRAMPFAPLTNILGPKGERWVPLHGILAHSDVIPFHDAFTRFLSDRQEEMAAHGLLVGTMFSSVGSTAILYEIALYWPDAQTPYHAATLDAATRAALPTYPESTANRAYVEAFKSALIDLFGEFGAAHFQIGRAYPYIARLDPAQAALLRAIKTQLDPRGLMNPGVLGL
jgi:D-lactate dehydrogenase (cytochrome)